MMWPSPQHLDKHQAQGSAVKDETSSDLGNPNQLPHGDLLGTPPDDFQSGFSQLHPKFRMSLDLQPENLRSI